MRPLTLHVPLVTLHTPVQLSTFPTLHSRSQPPSTPPSMSMSHSPRKFSAHTPHPALHTALNARMQPAVRVGRRAPVSAPACGQAHSEFQRPPNSKAKTTRRLRGAWRSSGWVHSFARRATRRAALADSRRHRDRPRESRADASVVSTASCTALYNSKLLVLTSMRRSSGRCTWTMRFRGRTSQATAALASLHTRAAARSRGSPRVCSNPDLGQAAR